jgi:hypothetical protein
MSQRRRRVPDRTYIGPRPKASHPAEFNPSPLPEEPKVTVWLVVAAVVVALVVIFVGSAIHTPTQFTTQAFRGTCPSGGVFDTRAGGCVVTERTRWDRVPMTVWFVYAALAATIVMIAPFLVYRVKRRTGQL